MTNTEITNIITGYKSQYDGKYWNAGIGPDKLSAANWGVTNSPCGSKCTSNKFPDAIQCYGFALFLGFLLTGVKISSAQINAGKDKDKFSGWVLHTAGLTGLTLEPGDIVRSTGGHSAVIWSNNGSEVKVAECWGSVGCKIAFGYFNGNRKNATQASILSQCKYVLKAPKSGGGGGSTIKVTFNANGGTCSQGSKNVSAGAPYGTLPTPTRAGYTFIGWWDDSKKESKEYTASTTVSKASNHTLYAHW